MNSSNLHSSNVHGAIKTPQERKVSCSINKKARYKQPDHFKRAISPLEKNVRGITREGLVLVTYPILIWLALQSWLIGKAPAHHFERLWHWTKMSSARAKGRRSDVPVRARLSLQVHSYQQRNPNQSHETKAESVMVVLRIRFMLQTVNSVTVFSQPVIVWSISYVIRC